MSLSLFIDTMEARISFECFTLSQHGVNIVRKIYDPQSR